MQDFIRTHREEISEPCRKHHVRRLSIFGSATRDDFDPSRSDVDVIVEFEDFPIKQYSDNKWALHDELAEKLNRKVDLLTWKSLKNPVIRSEVESTHVMLYAAQRSIPPSRAGRRGPLDTPFTIESSGRQRGQPRALPLQTGSRAQTSNAKSCKPRL